MYAYPIIMRKHALIQIQARNQLAQKIFGQSQIDLFNIIKKIMYYYYCMLVNHRIASKMNKKDTKKYKHVVLTCLKIFDQFRLNDCYFFYSCLFFQIRKIGKNPPLSCMQCEDEVLDAIIGMFLQHFNYFSHLKYNDRNLHSIV